MMVQSAGFAGVLGSSVVEDDAAAARVESAARKEGKKTVPVFLVEQKAKWQSIDRPAQSLAEVLDDGAWSWSWSWSFACACSLHRKTHTTACLPPHYVWTRVIDAVAGVQSDRPQAAQTMFSRCTQRPCKAHVPVRTCIRVWQSTSCTAHGTDCCCVVRTALIAVQSNTCQMHPAGFGLFDTEGKGYASLASLTAAMLDAVTFTGAFASVLQGVVYDATLSVDPLPVRCSHMRMRMHTSKHQRRAVVIF